MIYQPSLQTHFNYPVDRETLRELRRFGVRWCRMDAQTCDAATLHAMIEDCEAEDLVALPIVYDLDRLRTVPTAMCVEWGNEPDGDILPSTYRANLDAACALALELDLLLWGPCISNLDRDSLLWMELVRGNSWPAGLYGITAHRYGDGTFAWAHDGFASRDAEVEALLALCDGKPIMITEFGYPSSMVAAFSRRPKRTRFLKPDLHLTVEEQAANIALEWEFWRKYTSVPFLYQINDGPQADEGYGIRYCEPDGTLTDWKPAAYTFPQEDSMPEDTGKATYCISRSLSYEVDGEPGHFRTYYPKHGPTGERQTKTILSIQPNGDKDTRLVEQGGAWETWVPSKDGNRAIFEHAGEYFALPLVD